MFSWVGNVILHTMRKAIIDEFKQRFTGTSTLYIDKSNVKFLSIDSTFAFSLESLFIEDEIFSALKNSNWHKAPRLDRFFFKFSQSFQHVFKDGLMGLFQAFHSSRDFDSRFFESFIFLILKVKSLVSFNKFCPISLLGWVHKLIARVLMKRLRSIINQLVSHSQTTFIRGCNIHDGCIIASEVLEAMKKDKQSLIFKLDFEKAYDRVY